MCLLASYMPELLPGLGALQEPDNQYETPRVSPYRLAGHLASAFVIYGTLLWTSLTLAFPQSAASVAEGAATSACAALKQHALPLSCLIALTAVSGEQPALYCSLACACHCLVPGRAHWSDCPAQASPPITTADAQCGLYVSCDDMRGLHAGAFVAGNDAGHAYNTFPLMNGEWVPDAYRERPGWRNMFESTAAVQLHHRMLALTTLAASAAVFVLHRAAPLPRAPRLLLHGLAGMAGLQVRGQPCSACQKRTQDCLIVVAAVRSACLLPHAVRWEHWHISSAW